MVASGLCSFVASFFQENFVLFYILCFAVIFYYEKKDGFWKRLWAALWKLRFHILGGAVFLAIYFSFRMSCDMANYAGNSLRLTQPLTSVKVLLHL